MNENEASFIRISNEKYNLNTLKGSINKAFCNFLRTQSKNLIFRKQFINSKKKIINKFDSRRKNNY